jgi:antitoxin VapB
MTTGMVFRPDRSQAARLPKEFRVEDDKAHARRQGRVIVLEPLPNDGTWLDTSVRDIGGAFGEHYE